MEAVWVSYTLLVSLTIDISAVDSEVKNVKVDGFNVVSGRADVKLIPESTDSRFSFNFAIFSFSFLICFFSRLFLKNNFSAAKELISNLIS